MASDPMAQDIIRCDLCTKGTFSGITPAEVVCKTCNIYLCQVCMTKHVSSQLSVKHDILGICYHSPDFNFILPFCHIHPKLKCELNCQDCNIPVCCKCLAGPHKNHDFMEISTIFNSQKEIMKQDTEELKKFILPTYEKINAEYEDKISKVLGGYCNFKKAITNQGEEWHKIVDIVIRKHLKKTVEMETSDVTILQKDQSEIHKIQTSAHNIVQENKKILQSNDTNKVINYKSRNTQLRKVPAKTELSPPSFSPGKISEEMIEKMFGDVNSSMKTEVPAYNIHGYNEVSKQFIDHPKLDRIDSGFDNPWRVCCVPDREQLYVTGQNNSTIHHLDGKGELLNQITTKSGNEYGINLGVMRDGRLLYSDRDDRSVNKVNNNKIDTLIRSHGWSPLTVCCTSDNDLLVAMVSDNDKSKVVRYAGSTVTQEIKFDDHGKALYLDPRFIVENGNLDICVTDWMEMLSPGAVVVVDKAGKLKFKYHGKINMRKLERFDPWGLATDSQRHILVTDSSNHCVHILNHDGSFIRYIDSCNLNRPTDLSISSEDVLYVADGSKKLKVIQYLQ